jgi:hypothetical protein
MARGREDGNFCFCGSCFDHEKFTEKRLNGGDLMSGNLGADAVDPRRFWSPFTTNREWTP